MATWRRTARVALGGTLATAGGELSDATAQMAAGSAFTLTSSTANRLVGVTVDAGAGTWVPGSHASATVTGGLTLHGDVSLVGGRFYFHGSDQTLDGTATITTASFTYLLANSEWNVTRNLTIGPAITITGYWRVGLRGYTNTTITLDNQGTLHDTAGTAHVSATSFTNNGQLRAAGGGDVHVAAMTGTVGDAGADGAGSELRLDGDYAVGTGESLTVSGQGTVTPEAIPARSRKCHAGSRPWVRTCTPPKRPRRPPACTRRPAPLSSAGPPLVRERWRSAARARGRRRCADWWRGVDRPGARGTPPRHGGPGQPGDRRSADAVAPHGRQPLGAAYRKLGISSREELAYTIGAKPSE